MEWFNRSRRAADAGALLDAVSQTSRQPAFFAAGRVPDSLEGRLEMLTLHAILALVRLGEDPRERRLAQAFTDRLFRHVDAGLREAGVGDLSVPRRMRKIASQFYGRLEAYRAALADEAALTAALARNVFAAAGAPYAAALAAYVRETQTMQAAMPVTRILRLDGWRGAPA